MVLVSFLCRPSIFLYKCVTDQENTEAAASQVQIVLKVWPHFFPYLFTTTFANLPPVVMTVGLLVGSFTNLKCACFDKMSSVNKSHDNHRTSVTNLGGKNMLIPAYTFSVSPHMTFPPT